MRKNYKRLIGTVCGTIMLCSAIGFTAFADKSEIIKENDITIATSSTASPNVTDPENDIEDTTNAFESGKTEQKGEDAKTPEANILDNDILQDKESTVYAKTGVYAGPLEETPLFIPVTNPRWISGQPGMAEWDELDQDLQEKVKGVYLLLSKDGEEVAQRNFNGGYLTSMNVLEQFEANGSYQFQATYRMTDQYDGARNYLSDLSDSYDYTLPEKSAPVPTGYHWNKDGSVTWDLIKTSALPGWDTNKSISYTVSFYEGNNETPWDTWFMDKSPSIKQTLKMIPGKTYRFRISASGDGLNYRNSELSNFSEPFTMPVSESSTKVKLEALSQVNDSKLEETVNNLTLTDNERKAMKDALQNSSSAAEQLKELEARYKEASGKSFSVQAESNIIDSSQLGIAGAVLNGASKISFSPVQSTDAELSKYSNQASMDISLDTSDLKFPVLITMPVPSNMNGEKVRIYHYHENGTVEIITPRVITENGVKKIEFAVSGFSVFTFVDTSSSNTSSGSGGSDGGSGRGSSGGFASGIKSSSANKISETPGQWQQTETGWQFKKPDGSLYQNTWVYTKGKWYWIESTGTMAQGWKELNGKKYYLLPAIGEMVSGWVLEGQNWFYTDGTGAMQTGWVNVNGKWYYLEADGHMLSSTTTPDGYHVDTNGAWIQ
ncbi:N-acetylmuramoyl-L-alanine amidase family protein [Lacrimispora sp.]|uniref:N-acetylmuramoyl-L-alanine amidase family protein n=1 Tax=Lacrimispora sp. TaxID=2719234 RepID=UPI00345F9C1F